MLHGGAEYCQPSELYAQGGPQGGTHTTAEAVVKVTEEVAALGHQMRWMSKRQTAAAKAARKTETDCSADAKAATRAADVRLGAVLLLIVGMIVHLARAPYVNYGRLRKPDPLIPGELPASPTTPPCWSLLP